MILAVEITGRIASTIFKTSKMIDFGGWCLAHVTYIRSSILGSVDEGRCGRFTERR